MATRRSSDFLPVHSAVSSIDGRLDQQAVGQTSTRRLTIASGLKVVIVSPVCDHPVLCLRKGLTLDQVKPSVPVENLAAIINVSTAVFCEMLHRRCHLGKWTLAWQVEQSVIRFSSESWPAWLRNRW